MGNLFYRIASWTGAWKLMSEIRIAEKKRNETILIISHDWAGTSFEAGVNPIKT